MDPAQVARLYTKSNVAYMRFVRLFLYPRGVRQYFRKSSLLYPGQRVLDAGCGAGVVSFALREALASRGFSAGPIDAFDLTPAMLERFARSSADIGMPDLQMLQANVLSLETLPDGWSGYDLVVSSAMLEYVPAEQLVAALTGLRERIAHGGSIVIFISRLNWLNRPLIRAWWHANLYTADELRQRFDAAGFSDVRFGRFPAPYGYLAAWGHVVEARA